MNHPLTVINLEQAKFGCTFGRGCEDCCHNGRPAIRPEEAAQIDPRLTDILPLLRPEARAVIEHGGYLSARRKQGAFSQSGWRVVRLLSQRMRPSYARGGRGGHRTVQADRLQPVPTDAGFEGPLVRPPARV